MADSLSTTYTGRVVAVNERGLKLEGHEAWANVSKWAVGVVLPPKGATATVTLDAQGFIRACEVTELVSGAVNGADRAPRPAQTLSAPSGRDAIITASAARTSHDGVVRRRLAVLKAAAEFGASRPELKSGDVLAIATNWERWVTSPPKAVPEPAPVLAELDPFDSQARSGQATAF